MHSGRFRVTTIAPGTCTQWKTLHSQPWEMSVSRKIESPVVAMGPAHPSLGISFWRLCLNQVGLAMASRKEGA